jgi:hypothetical protein
MNFNGKLLAGSNGNASTLANSGKIRKRALS